MNFADMPELHWRYGYPVVIAAAVILVILEIIYFKKKKFFCTLFLTMGTPIQNSPFGLFPMIL